MARGNQGAGPIDRKGGSQEQVERVAKPTTPPTVFVGLLFLSAGMMCLAIALLALKMQEYGWKLN